MTMSNAEYKSKAVKAINNGKVATYVRRETDDGEIVTYIYRAGQFWTQANYDETGDTPELLGKRSTSPEPLERAIDNQTVYLKDADETPVADEISLK